MMTIPQARSLNQKLASQSRNVFVVVLLTYFPFSMIAFSADILVSFMWQSIIYEGTTALDNMRSNFDRFLLGWIWVKWGHAQPHIIVPIAWGLCCLYHRRLVFNLSRKTFWIFVPSLIVLWLYNPIKGHYISLMREDLDFSFIRYTYALISILVVLFCWWLVERWRAKLLPEE